MTAGSVPASTLRAFVDRDRALGVLADRDAGHAQRRGFLLQAAAVGQHHAASFHRFRKAM
jgi:hypothetical protein